MRNLIITLLALTGLSLNGWAQSPESGLTVKETKDYVIIRLSTEHPGVIAVYYGNRKADSIPLEKDDDGTDRLVDLLNEFSDKGYELAACNHIVKERIPGFRIREYILKKKKE